MNPIEQIALKCGRAKRAARAIDFYKMLIALRSEIGFADIGPSASARATVSAADRSSYGGDLPWR